MPSLLRSAWSGLLAGSVLWGLCMSVLAREPVAFAVPTVAGMPELRWPETLVRPDVHPQINAIEAAWATGDLAKARSLAYQHAAALMQSTDDLQRLDAQLALAMVLAGTDLREAQRRFAQVADNAVLQGGLYAPHVLPARASEGFVALQRGDLERAQVALIEALQLHRMRHGLHDPGQGVYLQALAAMADGAAAGDEVTSLLRRQMLLVQRQVTADQAAAAQLAERLPMLIHQLRQSTALAAMARPLRDLRLGLTTHLGEQDPSLIPLLVVEAHAAALHAIAQREPWDAAPLRRAHVALIKTDDLPPEARALSLIDVGNVWWLVGNPDAAMRAYQLAGSLGVAEAESRLVRAEVLAWPGGTPRALPASSAEGRLQVTVTVDARGRVLRSDAVTVDPADHPVGQARAAAWRSAIRRATVRPAVVEGRAVRRDDMVIQDRFIPVS